ncbi:HlyD family secretion protein [Agrobacterium pusense]|jgi:membrane fusion protein (multidrug efflux system)|uniref:HlyD family secretion protein n=1 Tax=Agrobacterium pusense TaxID=648995 RepID=UPI002452D276|nr:HlyD family secretion protein [Agrobacterium pusense]
MSILTFEASLPMKPAKISRRSLRLWAAAGSALAAIWFAAPIASDYWTHGRFVQSTNNAYIRADSSMIAPKVAGYISEVAVRDNQRVTKGQVLARIDPKDYRTAYDAAAADVRASSATIANIDAQIVAQQAKIEEAEANVLASEATLAFARVEHKRYEQLADSRAGTEQRAEEAAARLRESEAAFSRSQATVAATIGQKKVLETQRGIEQARLERAHAALTAAASALEDTAILAPIDGIIGSRTARVGQMVQPGNALMAVVPTDAIYVVANLKETQLTNVRGGEPAEVTVDAFPGRVLSGHLDSMSPATGLEFSLLPSDNATGNFTKIVQRVPVKIVIDDLADLKDLLRPGMSVEAEIMTTPRD